MFSMPAIAEWIALANLTMVPSAGSQRPGKLGMVPHPPLRWRAQAANLDSAVTAALLLLPAAFSSVDLLCVICGLSYMADIRMAFAEDSRKVRNAVLTLRLCSTSVHTICRLSSGLADHTQRIGWM